MKKMIRVVLTGGPGGGKSTIAKLAGYEFNSKVLVLPEAATVIYSNGFTPSKQASVRRANQKVIFAYQRGLEDSNAALNPGRILLCDRGTLDGAAYWPGGVAPFCKEMATSQKREFARYDYVLFSETGSHGGITAGGNPTRREDHKGAIVIDRALRKIWGTHPGFHLISHRLSFAEKVSEAISVLKSLIG